MRELSGVDDVPAPDTFGTWAAARHAALLRFAYLVTGSQTAGEDAVRTDRTDRTDHAEQHAQEDLVWRVCAALPPQQRAAVVLRFYEDLDYPEVARVLGVAETRQQASGRASARRSEHSTSTTW